jgi:hypothetical protein
MLITIDEIPEEFIQTRDDIFLRSELHEIVLLGRGKVSQDPGRNLLFYTSL